MTCFSKVNCNLFTESEFANDLVNFAEVGKGSVAGPPASPPSHAMASAIRFLRIASVRVTRSTGPGWAQTVNPPLAATKPAPDLETLQSKNEKPRRSGGVRCHLAISVGPTVSALAGLEAALGLVDYVNAAFAAHDAAIAIPVLERPERVSNLHGPLLFVVARAGAWFRRVPRNGEAVNMVGDTRIELVTPSMSTKCSTAELIALLSAAGPAPNE